MLSSKTNINVFHSIVQKKCQNLSLIQRVYDQHISVKFNSTFELVSHYHVLQAEFLKKLQMLKQVLNSFL